MVYQDNYAALLAQGTVLIERVSHVEPDKDGKWWADLSPVNGPCLGPYDKRADALDAEVKWINARYLDR